MATSTTFASSSPLENLPLPVLELICEYLASCGSKRRSLFAFSLASKFCCLASARQRFKQVSLIIHDREKLHQDMKRWEEILGIDERIRYLRRVKFLGYMSLSQDCKRAWMERIDEDASEKDEHEGEDDFFKPSKNRPDACLRGSECTKPQEEEDEARNKEWLPVARLLEQLPNLRDVVYACTHRIPICVLTVLHQHHPITRLHLYAFYLGYLPRRRCVLAQLRNDNLGIKPNEVLPLAPPCLHSIVVLHYGHDYYRQAHYSVSCVTENASGGVKIERCAGLMLSSPYFK